MRTTPVITAASLALAVLPACGREMRQVAPEPTAPAVFASPSPAPEPVVILLDDPLILDDPIDGPVDDDPATEAVRTLDAAPTPAGPVPAVALRYLQALQRGDWIGAARMLGLYTRTVLSLTSPAYVERVGRDVLAHVGGPRLGHCTSARRLTAVAAVVRCGGVNVVVHVDGLAAARGVLISAQHPRGDLYRGPHTHAYTGLLR